MGKQILAAQNAMNAPGRSGAPAVTAVSDGVVLNLRASVQADGATICLGDEPAKEVFARDDNVPGRAGFIANTSEQAPISAGGPKRAHGALGQMFAEEGSSENDARVLNCQNVDRDENGKGKSPAVLHETAAPIILG